MAGKQKGGRDGGATIVLKREEAGEHGHHGGAWKVAYADFVTAMMAFFLLMWLLNATTEEQRRGLADHFSPTNVLGRAATGSGQPFAGKSPNVDGDNISDKGAMRVERGPQPARIDLDEEEGEAPRLPDASVPEAVAQVFPDAARSGSATGPGGAPLGGLMGGQTAGQAAGQVAGQVGGDATGATAQSAEEAAAGLSEATLRAELARREAEALERAAEELRAAVRDDPALADVARQLLVEQVPEGLRIQLVDAERQPMFATGAAQPNERARALLARVAAIAAKLPNGIAVSGHTDAAPFRGDARSNWELSAERANAVRRVLLDGGIGTARIHSVAGHADRTPLLPETPLAAANRRVSVTLLRAAPDAAPRAAQVAPRGPELAAR